MNPKYQTGWLRLIAAFIDALVFLPLSLIEDNLLLPTENKLGFIFWIIFNASVTIAYSVLLHAKYGQTLGKMAMKVKIVDQSEMLPITLKQAFMRDLVGIGILIVAILYMVVLFSDVEVIEKGYDSFLGFWGLIWTVAELATMLSNPKRRAIHDFIAGTVVVRTK